MTLIFVNLYLNYQASIGILNLVFYYKINDLKGYLIFLYKNYIITNISLPCLIKCINRLKNICKNQRF